MFLACASAIECNVFQEIPCDIWYLYLGCRNHMNGNLNLFSNIDKSVQTDVTLGNNFPFTLFVKDIAGILTKQEERMCIHDVYHVGGLKDNLLSIGKLIQKIYKVYMEDNHCVIKEICQSMETYRKNNNEK